MKTQPNFRAFLFRHFVYPQVHSSLWLLPCKIELVSQSARKMCSLSLDHAMRSMLSANRRNIFPPPNAIVTMLCAKKSSKKGLDTRCNFSELSSLKPFNCLVMVHARACALVI